MKYQHIALLISFIAFGLVSIAQPYVVNDKVEKVFSEGFTDINNSFIITPSSDPKFWGFYGDGYYYMQRKIASPRAIIANADPISKNFSIKSKINLAPYGTLESSVGIIFLAQRGGKGGFVFEFNKKKKFRIKDLGTGAFITKEGDNGWLKSKSIAPPTRNNTIEVKGFRGQFDIYMNGAYIYSFVNNSYEKGKFGSYIGPNAEAKIYYYNVYNLDMPGAEPEVNLTNLTNQIEALKLENDSLKTLALTAIYGDSDKTAISAIKILEEQIQTVNKENTELKNILNEIHISKSVNKLDTNNQNQSIKFFQKLELLTTQRDSVIEAFNNLKKNLGNSILIQDSLNIEILDKKTEIEFMKEQLSQLKLEIAEDKLTKKEDSLIDAKKEISIPPVITNLSETLNNSDSVATDVTEENDSLINIVRSPSGPSEIAAFPQTSKNHDSLTSDVLEENDSLNNILRTPSTSSEITNFPKTPKNHDSLTTDVLEENDSLSNILRTPSTSSEITSFPKTPKNHDSLTTDVFEENDSLSNTLRTPSAQFKMTDFPKKLGNSDSLTTNVSEENHSLKNALRRPSTPSKIAVTRNIDNKIEISDSINLKELDTTLAAKNDSFLVKAREITSTPLKFDTIIDNSDELPLLDTVGKIELVKKDSLYMHTLNIDDEIGIKEEIQESILETDSINIKTDPIKRKKTKATKPKKGQKVKD